MKEKKKGSCLKTILIVIAVIAVLGILISSLGGDRDESTSKIEESSAASGESKDTEGSTEDPATEEPAPEEQETPTDKIEQSVPEQVLVEQGGIRITLKGFNGNSLFGGEWGLLIENDGDKGVTVQAQDVTVNGVMIETIFSADIEPGKKANDSIVFLSSDIEKADIQVMKDVSLKFHVFDSDTWETVFDTERITVSANEGVSYAQSYDDSGMEILNQDGFRIVAKKVVDEESFWGADLLVYIENNTDTDVTIQARDVSINGFMIDPMFSCSIISGAKAFSQITFMSSSLEENGIESIDSLDLSFHIFKTDGWDTILDSDSIAVNFN
ncbi:hypothetical protein LQZ18_08355 [Lachnospiraceae bacterium ZAX-1]